MISRLQTFKKSQLKTFLIAGDFHNQFLNVPTYRIMLDYSKTLKEPTLIINGDFFDFPFLMPRNPEFKRHIKQIHGIEEYFLPLYEDEIKWGNDKLDELQKYFKEIIYIYGNHDERAFYFSRDYSPIEYKHHFNLATSLNLEKRNIKYIHYNDWLDITSGSSGLTVTHGGFHGSACKKKHYLAAGKSVIFSHIHRDESECFISREETRKVWSLPSMADLNPDYLKNRSNNWTNGFGTALVYNGKFWVNTFNVWENKLVTPDGKIYE